MQEDEALKSRHKSGGQTNVTPLVQMSNHLLKHS
jgi:hypothetical protein